MTYNGLVMPALRRGKPFDWLGKPGVGDAVLFEASCREVARLAAVSHKVVCTYPSVPWRQLFDALTGSGGSSAPAWIDKTCHVGYAAVRVPLKSVSEQPVKAGIKWRANLYRIEGLRPDSRRHFMCWPPTCVVNCDPNHAWEQFGTPIFPK